MVPLRLMDEPWLDGQRIVMLEPRRLAARATARRMAMLLNEPVGATVGFRTRDEAVVGRSTRVEVVTDGILVRRLQRDPSLAGVGLIIFDEVHERSLQSDLAIAFTLDARQSLRPDLAVLAMSATVDVERMATLLSRDATAVPVVSSEGRAHPVDIRWTSRDPRHRVAEATATAIRRSLHSDTGDILVFLPGVAEIRRVATLLSGPHLPGDVDVRSLFGGLSSDRQDAALAPASPGRRKVVLSTDIAETSLTVEGVRVVIDAGEVRRPSFDHRSGLTRLVTGPNSRASAAQRSGRAGRTGPGVAYRLWSEAEHLARTAFAEPEISEADLTGLALEVAMWGARADELSFPDPPSARRLGDAVALLQRLGALGPTGRPTAIGREMSDLPLHPRLSHMVLRAHGNGQGWTACIMAALLEERDVLRGRPAEVPVDLEERVRLVDDPGRRHAAADTASVAMVRRRSKELARRAGIPAQSVELGSCGALLALAFPDRIAQSLGGGDFRLRNGQRVTMPESDHLTAERFLVVADTGPAPANVTRRDGPRDVVRIAAALAPADLERVAGDDIELNSALMWDTGRDELEQRVERRLGFLVLSSTTSAPSPGPVTTEALVHRVRDGGLDTLTWPPSVRTFRARASFARGLLGDPWPDVSDAALLASLGVWLAPVLAGATRRSDLERVDIGAALRNMLGRRLVGELDRILPATVALTNGSKVRIDYDTASPSVAARAQDLFGTNVHPTVAGGRLPLAVHVLSPAGRVVQVTSDLPGFWAGSWVEVRKELAGRYPRHAWPADPSTAIARR